MLESQPTQSIKQLFSLLQIPVLEIRLVLHLAHVPPPLLLVPLLCSPLMIPLSRGIFPESLSHPFLQVQLPGLWSKQHP